MGCSYMQTGISEVQIDTPEQRTYVVPMKKGETQHVGLVEHQALDRHLFMDGSWTLPIYQSRHA